MAPRTLLLALLILLTLAASMGIVPREALLIWTGIATFLILCSPLEDGLWLFLAAMPILPALPLTDRFDAFNAFILLIPLLAVRAWVERGTEPTAWLRTGVAGRACSEPGEGREAERNAPGIPWLSTQPALRLLTIGAAVLLGLMALSVLVAPDRSLALQRLIFFALAFGFAGVVSAHLARGGKSEVLRNALITATTIVVAGGFLQLILVKFTGLNTFWSAWALGVIPALFGDALSQVLLVANSWFAFLPGQPPTLRMFSVFPDSHSFAMWLIVSLAIILPRIVRRDASSRSRAAAAALAVLSLLGIILSGSRGTWISSLVALTVALAFLLGPVRRLAPTLAERIPKRLAAIAATTILAFLALFPVATALIRWSTGRAVTDQVLYERALTIADVAEVSNQGRLRIWQRTLHSIAARPLLGVGLNNYPVVLAQEPRESKKGSSAHNLYLHLAAEVGIPALLVVVAMGVFALDAALRQGGAASFFAFALLWAGAYSMFDVVLLQNRVWLLLLTLVMLAIGSPRWQNETEENQTTDENQKSNIKM